MLRNVRRILGGLFFVLITLLFLDFTGLLHHWFGWMAKIQLIPAILATNFIVVAVLLVLTLLFGRVYCSVICPLGVMQDGIEGMAGWTRKKKRYSYSPAINWLRYGMLLVFIIALVAHMAFLVSLIEPYSAFGRIAANLFAPVYRLGNNLFAFLAERADSYAFYSTEVYVRSGIALTVSIVTFLIISILVWRNGRTWCNTICPVGTLLGFVSKYSIFKPVIDPEKCTKCSLCSKNCKASCIDYKNFAIDHSRCVTCMNCLDKCKFDALHYTSRRPAKKVEPVAQPDGADGNNGMSRRSFLSVAGLFALSNTLKAQAPIADGGLAVIEDKKIPDRETPVLPPGSKNNRHFKVHCTGCQLCVSACPNNILRPSNNIKDFMQPQLTFERGYCRPECTRCGEVCPTNAINRITPVEKSSLQLGRAVWIKENCIVNREGETCTACERNCPTAAITLVPRAEGDDLKTPIVDTELCIGCGACEYVCPSRPLSAIYVEGITVHRTI